MGPSLDSRVKELEVEPRRVERTRDISTKGIVYCQPERLIAGHHLTGAVIDFESRKIFAETV